MGSTRITTWYFVLLKEKNQRPKMVLLVLKPIIPNSDVVPALTAVSPEMKPEQPVEIFWSTSVR